MKSRIARKLALYFATALLLFSFVIGAVFITLFRAQSIRTHKTELEKRALSIASALSEYMNTTSFGGRRGMQSMGGYGAYLRFIDDIAMADVWVVDEQLNLINSSMMSGQAYNYADLPENAEQIVKEVFGGKTTFSEGFSELLDTPTLTAGTPIQVGDRVVGAVLLHSPVEGMEEATTQGFRILAISILTALVLSVVLSLFLASSFTKPLNRMKRAALMLADGGYQSKTGVAQNDEIGELANSIDILSERLQTARSESDKLDKLRRDFVANISHELKTPVTVLRGSLEALCDGVVSDIDQVHEYHRQMFKETITLERLVTDLLDLSKLQNPDFHMDMQELDLCDILRDVVRSAAHISMQKSVDVQLEMDVQSYTIIGDYGRLRQMLLIVLDNAIKFSSEAGIVRVMLHNKSLSITDNGIGMSEGELPHIFDRFYKVKSEKNRDGSGLGLAIAKEIADRHGIDVYVSSQVGEGTEFEFLF